MSSDIKYDLYQVGGLVRDEILGLKSKDIDYSVVVKNRDKFSSAKDAFFAFEQDIKQKGYEVFLSSPDVFTIRSRFPNSKEVADFVISRKESGYIEGTRKPLNVELGDLYDDLSRRDFTVNAIAKGADGKYIDPFDGIDDVKLGRIRCPISAKTSFNDDPLRVLRAYRFGVTKSFFLSMDVVEGISSLSVERFKETVSVERVREELYKMFNHNTMESLGAINHIAHQNRELYDYIFRDCGIKMLPSMKD
jgi:tRNA nucleotidyltransferase/poly(A) polymerase